MKFRGASIILGLKNKLKLPSEDLQSSGPFERKMAFGNSPKRVVVTYTFLEDQKKEVVRFEKGFFKQEFELHGGEDQSNQIIKVAADKVLTMMEMQ